MLTSSNNMSEMIVNTYLARRNEEEVVNEMYGHLVDEDVVNKIITEVSSG